MVNHPLNLQEIVNLNILALGGVNNTAVQVWF